MRCFPGSAGILPAFFFAPATGDPRRDAPQPFFSVERQQFRLPTILLENAYCRRSTCCLGIFEQQGDDARAPRIRRRLVAAQNFRSVAAFTVTRAWRDHSAACLRVAPEIATDG